MTRVLVAHSSCRRWRRVAVGVSRLLTTEQRARLEARGRSVTVAPDSEQPLAVVVAMAVAA